VGSLFLAFHNPDSKAAAEQRIGEEGEAAAAAPRRRVTVHCKEAGGEAGCGTIARGVGGCGTAAARRWGMKSPLRRLRGFGHNHPKERRGHQPPPAKLDELVSAGQVRIFPLSPGATSG